MRSILLVLGAALAVAWTAAAQDQKRDKEKAPPAPKPAGPAPAPPAPAAVNANGNWSGTSSGDGQQCRPVTFRIVVRGDKIEGEASSPGGRSGTHVYIVAGTVRPNGTVVLEATRGGQAGSGTRSAQAWAGRVEGARMSLQQSGSLSCASPRSAVLIRG